MVENLWAQLKAEGRVQVRGSPASGKTVIRRLLANHILLHEPEYTVYFFDGSDERLVGPSGWIDQIQNTLGDHPDIVCADTKYRQNVLLIDKAQMSYWDKGVCVIFYL